MSECRSCHQPIEWVIVAKSGKRMPIDPDPVEGGNIAKLPDDDDETGAARVEYVAPGGMLVDDRPVYVSHFATCPQADQHRRKP